MCQYLGQHQSTLCVYVTELLGLRRPTSVPRVMLCTQVLPSDPAALGEAALPSSRAVRSPARSTVLCHAPQRGSGRWSHRGPWQCGVRTVHCSSWQSLSSTHAGHHCLRTVMIFAALSAVAFCIFPELLQIPTRSGMGSWHFHHAMQHWTCYCARQRDLPKPVLSRSSDQLLYWHRETMNNI